VLVRLARLFLVVALLAGWQSALVHPLAHVDEQGKLVHLGEPSKKSADASCDVLAALTACAPQASAAFPVSVSSYVSPIHLDAAPRAAAAPPFLSQGPPAPL
jgi:hypothetical protein